MPAIAHSLSLVSRSGEPIHTMEEWRDSRKAVNSGWVPGKSATTWPEGSNSACGYATLQQMKERLPKLKSSKWANETQARRGVMAQWNAMRVCALARAGIHFAASRRRKTPFAAAAAAGGQHWPISLVQPHHRPHLLVSAHVRRGEARIFTML
jgi:hypothetical protein